MAEADGSALGASLLYSYTRGWSHTATRQDVNGLVRAVMEAMWMRAQQEAPVMLGLAAGAARAEAVLSWQRGSKFPGE